MMKSTLERSPPASREAFSAWRIEWTSTVADFSNGLGRYESMPPPSTVKDIAPPAALTSVAANGFATGVFRVGVHHKLPL